MTICIVARCTENDSFVVAGDRLFSYGGGYSYDGISLKRIPISRDRRWHLMFSGEVANVLPVLRRVRHELDIRRSPYALEMVERACIKAYQDYREQLVNDDVLSVYKITLSSYVRTGLKRFGPQQFARINHRIENVRVGVDFIVYGYDHQNAAHLFTLCESDQSPFRPEVTDREQCGIAVIGCGYGHAVASLLSSPLPTISQAEMLCRVCEAKFEAEKDEDVGTDSAAGVVNRPRSTQNTTSEVFITLPALKVIRECHDRREDRPYPQYLLNGLVECVKSNITTERMHEAVWRAEQMIIAENQQRRGY